MTHPMIGDTKTGERPRKPLMSDDEINGKPLNVGFPHMLSPYKVRDFYEVFRPDFRGKRFQANCEDVYCLRFSLMAYSGSGLVARRERMSPRFSRAVSAMSK